MPSNKVFDFAEIKRLRQECACLGADVETSLCFLSESQIEILRAVTRTFDIAISTNFGFFDCYFCFLPNGNIKVDGELTRRQLLYLAAVLEAVREGQYASSSDL